MNSEKTPRDPNKNGTEHPDGAHTEPSVARGHWEHEPVTSADAPPLEDRSTWQLAKMLVPATMRRIVAAIPLSFRRRMINFFAIVALIAPLALWIAPSTTIWFSILGMSLFSIAILVCLVVYGPEEFF